MQKTRLLRQFHALEQARQKLIDELKTLDTAMLQQKPAADKWSVCEVLDHLQVAEAFSIGYAAKKMQGGKSVKKTGLASAARATMLSVSLRSGLKWKAPAVIANAVENLPFDMVVEKWDAVRQRMKDFVEQLPDELIGREIYRHPYGGRLNAAQMLQFFEDHFYHHLKQIKRIRKSMATQQA